jgi:polar amino acid transport system substrate-binding protein
VFNRNRVLLPVIAAVAAGATVLSGCSSSANKPSTSSPNTGSTSTGTTTGTTTGTSTGAAPGADAAVVALIPAAVKSKGTLTVATDASYPPDESVAKDGHTIIGMDADLAKALGTVMGLKVKLVNATFDTIIPGLQGGKYDIGLSSFTDNKDREKTVDFVTYFQAGEGFYVKAGSGKKFDGLSSLCGHTVSVESGTTEETDAKSQGKKCKVTVLSFADQSAANLAVSSGRADVGFADSQVADYIVKQANGQFESSGTAFEVAPYGIALPKGNGMAPAVQAALKALIADGTYTKIMTTWGVQAGAITAPVINGATS